jgi:pimeloyl-ACP methyl ester carboxylesterase
MKTVLLVPGFMEDLGSRDYGKLIKAIEDKGYRVKFVPIKWRRTTIVEWVDELNKVYSKYNSEDVILAGFSFGAMTSLVSASKRNPSQLWLFSLSPYFSDNIPHLKKWVYNLVGKNRCNEFSKLIFKSISSKIECKTLIFIGEKEITKYSDMEHRSKIANQLIKNSQLIVVPGAEHDVADTRYIESIKKSI